MGVNNYQEIVEEVIEENRVLALSTTDGTMPWVARLEYLHDDAGNLYFGSPTTSRHARHIEENETVAVAIWEFQGREYGPETSATLNGVQMRAEVRQLSSDEYPQVIEDFIEEGPEPKMPPYAVYKIHPRRVYVPVLEDGVNKRVEVDLW